MFFMNIEIYVIFDCYFDGYEYYIINNDIFDENFN